MKPLLLIVLISLAACAPRTEAEREIMNSQRNNDLDLYNHAMTNYMLLR